MEEIVKKDQTDFGKGALDIVNYMKSNQIKAMDQIIEDPDTGKRYFLAVNEIRQY